MKGKDGVNNVQFLNYTFNYTFKRSFALINI